MPKSAKKMPRYPHYKKRAASKCNTTRVANRSILEMSDDEVRRVHGDNEAREAFVADVKKSLPPTRQTTKFLRKKKLILIMGREAFNDRKLQLLDTPSSNGSRRSRQNRVRRRLFSGEATPKSPAYNQSPMSINDFVDDALRVDAVNFDPEAAAAAFFNGIENEEIDFVFEEAVPEQDVIILVPMEEEPAAVPIEDEPVQEPVGAFNAENIFKPEDDLDEILDNQMNVMEQQMSPPDYWGHVLLNEE